MKEWSASREALRIVAIIPRAAAHKKCLPAQSQSFNAHMDNIDRSSKITQDYILDRSVVRDTENGDRATVSNGYADSLVRANPDRFQVVPNQNLLAGKDY
jgi:hypothetical protein